MGLGPRMGSIFQLLSVAEPYSMGYLTNLKKSPLEEMGRLENEERLWWTRL